ncbi:hypothetical protein BDA99DRAFT_445086 [Phascolomyces articulosus]|uniref:RNB domain-containing protein n=1 Tax=Phascolomyces articulosus TaxID=60185 RepID=A0AAD5P9L8_9FUNG|nr:hypothetical protein BDA99DRAFT_445086 [Phascolomyces articulosus]
MRPVIHLGDYVEIFNNGQFSGVVIGQRKASGGRQVLTILLRNGKTREFNSTTVKHVVPDFVQNDIRLSKFPFDPLAESLPDNYPVASFTRRVMDYQRMIQLRKGLGLKQFNKMYSHFHQLPKLNTDGNLKLNPLDPFDGMSVDMTVSLETLTQFAFDSTSVTDEQRHATFLYLTNDNIHFIPTTNVRLTGLWTMREYDEMKKISQVIESVRSNSTEFTDFLARAKKKVEFYQTHADPMLGTFSEASLNDLFPAQEQGKVMKLLEEHMSVWRPENTDAKYINFIADWIKSPSTGIHTPHEIFAPTILKALGCYDDHLFVDRGLAMQFLKQIGMFTAWDNATLVQNANHMVDDYVWSEKAKKMDNTMELHANLFLQGQLDRSGFHARDPCDRIRHDFGDMPVYTIDDPAAKEIDDGISIERIPGGNTWLHVHIADPSAYIPPTHPLAQVMEQRGQSLYLPEQHYPILPNKLASEKFSLGSSAQTNSTGSQYALTFSCRLDKNDGSVQAWKIQPSLIKNIKKLYYNDVDQFLKPFAKDTIPYEPLVNLDTQFIHPKPTQQSPSEQQPLPSTVTKECEQDLKDIFQLTLQHCEFRFQNGALNFVRPSPYIELNPQPLALPDIHFTRGSLPKYSTTLPTIRFGLDNSGTSPAKKMVAEAMILGGRIASHYAQEHGIILPHRTQTWLTNNDNGPNSDIALRQEMMSDRDPKTGTIGLANVVQYMTILPPASITTTAGLPHVLMGIPNGYVKATSPLRRYLDMVTHWQLKAHLLKEPAPFSRERLDQMLLPRMEAREKQLSFLQQDCLQYWVIELMNRLMAEGEGREKEWTCLVNLPSGTAKSELGGTMESARVTILELGLRARVQNLKTSLHMGQVVKARVTRLDSFKGFVDLELV